MNNLDANYKRILEVLKKISKEQLLSYQRRKPKMSDLELISLTLTAEFMSINTELQLFRCLSGSYLDSIIERSVYNKRHKKLFNYTEAIRKRISEMFTQFTDVFILDSMPTPICQYSRANRSNLCATKDIKPSRGYCASQKSKYYGYKLHTVCDKNGVFHSFDLTPAHVHDVNYLKDVKHALSSCTLIGDRGCISADYQQDLFTSANIKLSVPLRKNQKTFVPFSKTKARIRKRIETCFSQLNGQFLWQVNHAKSFEGLATRLLSKITAFTVIQYLNVFIFNRKINKTKINLT